MSNPTISVIVPVYEAEKYLNECIESILNQTFSDLELILVDDGSTDRSGEICDAYKKQDARVRVLHKKNGGVSSARNTGIELSRGTYLTFVDSDDYLTTGALEKLYMDIITYEADISCCLMCSDSEVGRGSLQNGIFEIWKSKDALIKSLEDNHFTYSSCAKLYRKDFLGDIRFDEGRKIHEDSYFVFCCFYEEPTVVVNNVGIYHYRNNNESASHAEFSEKFFDILYFADKKRNKVITNYPEYRDYVNNMIVKANLAMLHCFCEAKRRQYKKEIRECIKRVKSLKKYFIPAVPGDKKWFWIVTNNLYYMFRIYYDFRYKKR